MKKHINKIIITTAAIAATVIVACTPDKPPAENKYYLVVQCTTTNGVSHWLGILMNSKSLDTNLLTNAAHYATRAVPSSVGNVSVINVIKLDN